MRALLLTFMLACVALSGCSGSGGLSAYLVNTADLPAGCQYLDYDGPAGKQMQEHYGWTGNPGRFDPERMPSYFGDDSMQILDNRVAMLECEGEHEGEVMSMALRFADANATAFLEDPQECDDASYIVNGPIFAFFDADVAGFTGKDAEALAKKIAGRTGGTAPCIT